jgi:alkanesulfonate monooxygenase SsuD/methylene tetrahydromethanopterin reductase-like flavin-dependent oxidoreductase (luciferase family)
VTIRVGLTLPSFVDDPEIPITVARAAEDADLDAVFVYDHLWRGDPPNRRPALECFALLGAVAAETRRVGVGTLVARATLRPPATLANGFETAHRIAGEGRLIAAIGAGDSQSRAENEAFGLDFGSMVDRVNALHDSVRAAAGDFPVWVGGRATQVREIVAVADGWNSWGAEPDKFAQEAASVLEVAPNATLTWGGLARPREEGAAALADRLAPYVAAGATWVIVGPVDSSDPGNAAVVGEVRERLNSPGYRAAAANP